ncbi:UNVERIFIED_CONTAM: hypothetical protein GTU68_005753 [Idotea baltica]|nr:hypothetical protein [Idotea baltica]
MLVLSRKLGESVTIGNEVTITALSVSGKQVRIGIDAPSDIAVHREEIYNKIENEKHTETTADENK